MRALSALLTVLALGGAFAACGAVEDTTPAACLEGTASYLGALRRAPGTVTLKGDVPISGCLVEGQKAGDLATVGGAMVSAATRLNSEARARPGGDANLELGYLLGAAQRGADGTEGIHAELIRRLTAAGGYSPDNRPLPAAFKRTYREGFDAGHAGG
jgi:hypothetical protein